MKTRASKNLAAQSVKAELSVPHSWAFESWPPSIWPNDPEKAKWTVRSNKNELIAAGAISRVGKQLVIIGHGYARWLERRVTRVGDYQGNNPAIRKSA